MTIEASSSSATSTVEWACSDDHCHIEGNARCANNITNLVTRLLCDPLDSDQKQQLLKEWREIREIKEVHIDGARSLSDGVLDRVSACDMAVQGAISSLGQEWRKVIVMPDAEGMTCFFKRQTLSRNLGCQIAEGFRVSMRCDQADISVTPVVAKISETARPLADRNRCAALLGELGVAPRCLALEDGLHIAQRFACDLLDYMNSDKIRRAAGPSSQTVFTCYKIAKRMEQMHSLGLMHNDLKPENVVLHLDGGGYAVDAKIIDLDSMRFVSESRTAIAGFIVSIDCALMLENASPDIDLSQLRNKLDAYASRVGDMAGGIQLLDLAAAENDPEYKLKTLENNIQYQQQQVLYALRDGLQQAIVHDPVTSVISQAHTAVNSAVTCLLETMKFDYTAFYAAPEIRQFRRDVKQYYQAGLIGGLSADIDFQKCDIWSLGMIILGCISPGDMEGVKSTKSSSNRMMQIQDILHRLSIRDAVLDNPHAQVLLKIVRCTLVENPHERLCAAEIAHQLQQAVLESRAHDSAIS